MSAETRAKVVVRTPDVVGKRMAGPGIRAWQIARALSRHFSTSLVGRPEGQLPDAFPIIATGSDAERDVLRDADVLIGQPARGFRRRRREQRVIYDLFDPLVLELRELYGSSPSMRQRVHLFTEWSRLTYALRNGDALMIAAPQQRDFYGSLRSSDAPWVEVPFGIDPVETRVCAKPQDAVVVWGGGLWEWLDPATAVDAVLRLNQRGIRARLLFLGRGRPNPTVFDRRRENRFEALLDRGGPFVSCNDEWVPYDQRLAWLRAGKVAIMLHRPTPEADFAIRTRLFDAIAAAVPVVATERGFAAQLVEEEGLGVVVPAGNVDAVSSAIERLLTDDVFHTCCVRNLQRIQPSFAWERVTRPLVDIIHTWPKQPGF